MLTHKIVPSGSGSGIGSGFASGAFGTASGARTCIILLCQDVLYYLQVPFLAAAAMWRAAVQVSAPVPVAAAARRAPAAAAEDAAAAVAVFVRPSFDVRNL